MFTSFEEVDGAKVFLMPLIQEEASEVDSMINPFAKANDQLVV